MPLRRESEQHIPWHAAEARIARIDEHHSMDHYCARSIEGAALGFNAVHRLEFSGSVKIPENLSVFGAIAAQMAIVGAREYNTRHGGNGRGLSRTTSRGCALGANDRWG